MTRLTESDHWMTTWDGTTLFYRAWEPAIPADRAIVLFHRGHEHSGRFRDLAETLPPAGAAVFAWDARGHGRSPGERGDAPSLACLVRDVDAFVIHLSREHKIPLENIAVVGHSVGAVLAAAWIHDFARPIRALVLACPAFRVKLYVPLAVPLLRLLRRLRRRAFVQSYVKARMLTHDPVEIERYRSDPLITRAIAVNVLLDLHDLSRRLAADAGATHVRTLVLAAGSDWVVDTAAQREFFEGLASPLKELEIYPGFHHDLFHERGRALPIARARAFLERAFERPPDQPDLLDADRRGHTAAEYARLSRPLPALSPRRLCYAGAALLLRTVGRLSAGVRIGWRSGFDSGESLDYVYRDAADGLTPLGRWLDRVYLDRVGWRAIRWRRATLQRLLRTAIERVHAEHRPVRLLDVAGGPGRYVLEVVHGLPHIPVFAVMRDRDGASLEAGRTLARELGLHGVVYVRGDAFDRGSLAQVTPRPTIAVVSGLYELVPDNAPVLASLWGIHDALADGGFLLYTNQPWHPQLELIARTLVNREGRPWVMRRRSQAEMDALVRAAGFEKLEMEIAEDGISSVSVARKRDER